MKSTETPSGAKRGLTFVSVPVQNLGLSDCKFRTSCTGWKHQ